MGQIVIVYYSETGNTEAMANMVAKGVEAAGATAKVVPVVSKITGDPAYKRRIMDMGITKGSEVYIRKVAPLGDPVEITIRGYELSLRKHDAACVEVKQK